MRVALAVPDVDAASAFYQELGFEEVFSIPSHNGGKAMAFLSHDESDLLLGPLTEPHYEHEDRAALIQAGPPGLGVTLLLEVDDLAEVHEWARERALTILQEPLDEYYGDRAFFFLDPFGYEWKIAQQIEDVSHDEVHRRATGGP
jgi:catechol 2,3-dioxygenase-like lactoylglutathione lyase family enzyme